jgi:methyltransferase (TIGR00027 family)
MVDDLELAHVSDTALIVARIRGHESQRVDRLFNDHLAYRLAGPRGESLGQAGESRPLARKLSESLRNTIVVRTVLMDEVILKRVREGKITCVVNLGAGLDARPYRLDLPESLRWIEVDFPEMIAYKNDALAAETPHCRLERAAVDLRIRQERERFFAGLATESVLVITEGLLLYLKENEVRALANELRHAGILHWVADVNSPRTLTAMSLVWSFQLKQNIQFQFGHNDSAAFFAQLGWHSDQSLSVLDQRLRLKRDSRVARFARWMGGELAARLRRSSVIHDLTCSKDFSK